MIGFEIVVLWSDVLVWLLVVASVGLGLLISRSPPLLAAWRRVGANRVGMASATVLLAFIAVGLLDSLHYRLQLDGKPGQKAVYAIEVLSVLDALAEPLRSRQEKTYSAPFATRLSAKASSSARAVARSPSRTRRKRSAWRTTGPTAWRPACGPGTSPGRTGSPPVSTPAWSS